LMVGFGYGGLVCLAPCGSRPRFLPPAHNPIDRPPITSITMSAAPEVVGVAVVETPKTSPENVEKANKLKEQGTHDTTRRSDRRATREECMHALVHDKLGDDWMRRCTLGAIVLLGSIGRAHARPAHARPIARALAPRR
jgi:hypothetical protein